MIDWRTSEPMKYWSLPANYTKEKRKLTIDEMIASGRYCYSLKTDGNWTRAIVGVDNPILQTRGISVNTGTYGEVQDKVLWWNDVTRAFQDETVIIGETYLDGGVDRDVGSILRCLPDKALARQKKVQLKWRIFDVLVYDGVDIHEKSIMERMMYIPRAVKRINNPLVNGVNYYEVNDKFYDKLAAIFSAGGEGVVMYDKNGAYYPGKRTAHLTCKVKKELEAEADVICTGFVPAIKDYTGKDVQGWDYWQNMKTGQKIRGYFYNDYVGTHAYMPITKGYYYGWPGAIQCSVYDGGRLVHVCDVSGITESMKQDMLDNPDNYLNRPMKVTAMEVTPDGSLRHPRFMGFRDDINIKDCTLKKIIG